jgi:endogenous inhibitor of DNA gyrase (YacG/DUF329 family)
MAKSDPVRLRPKRACPICGRPSQQSFHPFCSARCAEIDLGRWLGGRYAIPSEESPDERPRGNGEDEPTEP